MKDIKDKVAVVTGGAFGIGRGIVEALIDEGAKVYVADIEAPVLEKTVAELAEKGGDVVGVQTDVSDFGSVDALAQQVFDTEGRCNLLFNNAGVTSGGGGKPWEQELNDWRWCFSVNVFGPANGVIAFVPRMIESGEPGHVINTSSGDGGFAPVPYASVYASSKAAVSCFTEALAHQLASEGTDILASVFYPGGGLLDTGLWEAQRNRPDELARQLERPPAPGTTVADLKKMIEAAGPDRVMDLNELGRFVVQEVKAEKYIIGYGLDGVAKMLHERADQIAEGKLPAALTHGGA